MVDSQLSDLVDRIEASPLSQHAHKIGILCLFWSQMERQVGAFLQLLMGVDDEQISVLFANHMAFRDQLSAIRTIGFVKRPNTTWYDELNATLVTIDEDLRPARNRMVHDMWFAAGDNIYRISKHSKVVKEQARTFALKMFDVHPISVGEILALSIRVLATTGDLDVLADQYRDPAQHTLPEKSS